MRGDLTSIFAGETLDSSELLGTTRIVVTTPWGLLGGAEVSQVTTYLGNNGLASSASLQRNATVFVDGTNGSDSTGARGYTTKPYATLSAAAAAAQTGDAIIVYPGTYTHGSGSLEVKDDQHWIFLDCVIDHTATDSTLFDCSANDFSIDGQLKINGTGYSNPGSNSSKAFNITNSTRFSIANVSIGANIGEANGNTNGYCGTGFYGANANGGIIHSCHTRYCLTGINFIAGAEYNRFSDCSIEYSSDGVIVSGGNNTFTNCHSNRNTIGLKLGSGSNHGHGSWIGGTLNHNTTYSIYADSVTLGFLISTAHMYADDGTNNRIRLHASQGIVLNNCGIASSIELTGTLPGTNLFHGCYIPFNPSYVTLTDTGTQVANLVLADCYKTDGAWTSF